jgi:hypothetical protein
MMASATLKAFIEQWRRGHAEYPPFWVCPLCNQVLQGTYSERQTQERVEWHQGFHGDAWKRYAELVREAAPPAAGPEADG